METCVRAPVVTADQYRKEANEFFDLAKNAPSPFFRGYYQRIAERYLLLATEDAPLKIAAVKFGWA